MKKLVALAFLILSLLAGNLWAQERKFSGYAVGFYNLENLFDTCHDAGKRDYDFLPTGSYKWNAIKYSHKLANMARVLSEMGTDKIKGIGCAFIGVSEVENAKCLTDLCAQEPLAKRGIQFIHYEGVDKRGVDCALLYNPKIFKPTDSRLIPFRPDEGDTTFFTRGFLTVTGTLAGEPVGVVVCHLPSRLHPDPHYRNSGGQQLCAIRDSLIAAIPGLKLFIMGDMNDDPSNDSMAKFLRGRRKIKDVKDDDMYNPWWDVLASGTGTLRYDGSWNLFDQILLSPSLLDRDGKKDYSTLKYLNHQVFRRDYLFQDEGKYKGNPKRTHAGGVWLDGYSDHLPTVVYLVKEQK